MMSKRNFTKRASQKTSYKSVAPSFCEELSPRHNRKGHARGVTTISTKGMRDLAAITTQLCQPGRYRLRPRDVEGDHTLDRRGRWGRTRPRDVEGDHTLGYLVFRFLSAASATRKGRVGMYIGPEVPRVRYNSVLFWVAADLPE
jgi:hypothetical protein